MPAKAGRAWKQERATDRKYSDSDAHPEPTHGEREKFWVSGYTRADGRKVAGYYKRNPAHKEKASSAS